MSAADWIWQHGTAIVLVLAVYGVLTGFRTQPLTFWPAYRRWRGGRWARVARGWIRFGGSHFDPGDEDWRKPPILHTS